jgi:hypothetical protein
MKLRLQLESMLPTSPKTDSPSAHGEAGFGTAMEEMMATSFSGKPLLVETPYAPLFKQPQTGTQLRSARPNHAVGESSGEVHAAEGAQAEMPFAYIPGQQAEQGKPPQGQAIQGQSCLQSSSQSSPLSEQPPAEQPRQGSILQVLLTRIPIVQELGAKLQPRGQKPSPAGATSDSAESSKEASAHAKHKTETVRNEPTHPVDGPLAGALPVISQPINGVVPLPTLQADGPQPTQAKSDLKAVSEAVRSQGGTGRRLVPQMLPSHGGLNETSLRTPGSPAMPQSPRIAPGKGDRLPESVSSDTNSERSTKTHLASAPAGKANASVVVPPNEGSIRKAGIRRTVSRPVQNKQTPAL